MKHWWYWPIVVAVFLFFWYFGLVKGRLSGGVGAYADHKTYVVLDGGLQVSLPEVLQKEKYKEHILSDVKGVFTRLIPYYEEKYGVTLDKPVWIIIEKQVDVFHFGVSPTGFATGTTQCGNKGMQVNIALRPEEKGKNGIILHSKGGYLKPLGWELKNVMRCQDPSIGPWDFRPEDEVLRHVAEVMDQYRFPYEVGLEYLRRK